MSEDVSRVEGGHRRSGGLRGRRPAWRSLVRIAVSAAVSALACAALWTTRPRSLQAPIDVVGYPSYADFNFNSVFLGYRLAVYGFVVIAAVVFAVLRRWGPLAAPRSSRVPVPRAGRSHVDRTDQRPRGASAATALLGPAALLVVAVGAPDAAAGAHVDEWGLVAAALFVVVTLALAELLVRVVHLPRWTRALPTVNAVTSTVAAIAALGWFGHTTRAIRTDGQADRFSWVAVWLAALVAVGLVTALLLLITRGADPVVWERRVISILVGSVAVFVLTARMSSSVGPIQGFDDMMSATGGQLFADGQFPWRDFLFIHGLLEDVFRSTVGFALFGHTFWATQVAATLLWVPLCWVGLYLLGVWFAPGRGAPVALLVVGLVFASTHVGFPIRWVLAAPVLILLGEALRRGSHRWTALMTTAIFVECILTPEAVFELAGVVVVVVASDLAHRPVGIPVWRSLRMTRDFVLTGLALTVVWSVFLAANGALVPFVRYFIIFGPGHAASGALPLSFNPNRGALRVFVTITALAALTFVLALHRLWTRREVSPAHWVILAASVFSALYGEKALGRIDDGHLYQSVSMGLLLVTGWVMLLLTGVDSGLADLVSRARWPTVALGALRFGALATPMALALLVPGVASVVWHTPTHNVAGVLGPPMPGLGYTTVGSVDPAAVDDVRQVADQLRGQQGAVFDFTNSPGYFYFLFRDPSPTTFYHVSMAIPAYSQRLLIGELEQSRPPVVAFDSTTFSGLPAWDNLRNEVRHYDISQYLLDHYTPVADTHGVLMMLRDDLVSTMPQLTGLSTPAETTDLDFSVPTCDWGLVPNFLTSTPSGPSVALEVSAPQRARRIHVSGWAYDVTADAPAREVVVAVGSTIVGRLPAGPARYDVAAALGIPGAASSGFAGDLVTTTRGRARVYVVLSDGVAHPVVASDSPPVTLLDRSGTIPVGRRLDAGAVDGISTSAVTTSTVQVPAGVDLTDYQLATFTAGSARLGRSSIDLFDQPDGPGQGEAADQPGRYRTIRFGTPPSTDGSVSVRVGSCLQWHGYSGSTLTLSQAGGRPVTGVVLSGVAD